MPALCTGHCANVSIIVNVMFQASAHPQPRSISNAAAIVMPPKNQSIRDFFKPVQKDREDAQNSASKHAGTHACRVCHSKFDTDSLRNQNPDISRTLETDHRIPPERLNPPRTRFNQHRRNQIIPAMLHEALLRKTSLSLHHNLRSRHQ